MLASPKLNHSFVEPGSPPSAFLTRTQILADLKKATVVFAYTHGEPGRFLPSVGAGGGAVSASDYLATNGPTGDVGQAVLKGRTNPLPNLVIMDACSLLSSGDAFAKAVGIISPNGNLVHFDPDRALLGFPDVVNDRIIDPMSLGTNKIRALDDKHLSDHAKIIYADLLAGKTVGQALENANGQLMTSHSTCETEDLTRMDMKYQGDPYARLVGIYTGNKDSIVNADGSLLWHLLIPALPPPAAPSGGSTPAPTPIPDAPVNP